MKDLLTKGTQYNRIYTHVQLYIVHCTWINVTVYNKLLL